MIFAFTFDLTLIFNIYRSIGSVGERKQWEIDGTRQILAVDDMLQYCAAVLPVHYNLGTQLRCYK